MKKNLVNELHPHEKKILLSLKKLEEATTTKIASEAKIPPAAVHKAGLWAKLKGLITHKEEKEITLSLTVEGKKYVKEGLPEKQLIKQIAAGKTSIKQINVPQLQIALAWAKKKDWVKIKNQKLSLTPAGKKALKSETATEKLLKKIEKEASNGN